MDNFNAKSTEVGITITAPSDNEIEESSSSSEEDDLMLAKNDNTFDTPSDDAVVTDTDNTDKEKELCERFDSGVSLNNESSSPDAVGGAEKENQNYEIVGDRVLIEKDGKFELVDANEIKAEYFEMLGIKSDGSDSSRTSEIKDASESSNSSKHNEIVDPVVKKRPQTTPARGSRENRSENNRRRKRVQSSWGVRNSEYSNIKSPYGLSEEQLEIKRKREEAIARRKKEEAEKQREEERLKREDAERAFQAWLNLKKEEEKVRQRQATKNTHEKESNRVQESKRAFKAWKVAKRKQENAEREAEMKRMQETASMYVIHDRGACEEAFRRWLRKKKGEKRAKEIEKKKQLKERSLRRPKEALPINSEKIRFTDNYGYRNTVVY